MPCLRVRVVAVVAFWGLVWTAAAQEVAVPPPVAPHPVWASAHCVPVAASADGELQELDKVADRLKAAGLDDEAQKLRRLRSVLGARIRAMEALVGQPPSRTPVGPQILVHVKLIELSRTKLQRLGFDLAQLHPGPLSAGTGGHKASAALEWQSGKPAPPGGSGFTMHVVDQGSKLLSVLETLRKDGLVRVIAEPTLVTVSGRPACLHVGGEVPIWRQGKDGSTEVERRPYGTEVDVLPILVEGGRIRLELRPRVTEIDPARTVQVAGHANPVLRTWQIDTAVEMRAGQTIVLGGLVQKRQVQRTATTSPESGAKDETEQIESLCVASVEVVQPLAERR